MNTQTEQKTNLKAHEIYSNFLTEFDKSFIDKSLVVQVLATAIVAQKSVAIVGDPGTGKSMVINAFAAALEQSYFQYLLTRYTTPDEILGHFSLKELKDNDKYVRSIDGKLPTAKIVFLDEAFKASSALQNSLLTVLNEKQIDMGDGTRIPIPMELICAASNEYPIGDKSLEALWDRWLFRIHSDRINLFKSDNFDRLILEQNLGKPTVKLDFSIIEELRVQRDKVDLTPVLPILKETYGFLMSQKMSVSERRWRQCADIIRSRSAMAGRLEAAPSDVRILSEVLWTKPEERALISGKITELCAGLTLEAYRLHDAAVELYDKLKTAFKQDLSIRANKEQLSQTLFSVQTSLKELVLNEISQFEGETDPEIVACIDMVKQLNERTISHLSDWITQSKVPTDSEFVQ